MPSITSSRASDDGRKKARPRGVASLTSADVVVVGAGGGGLTCAAYLAGLGNRVIVIDRHVVPGGNITNFTHDDYEFDVGLHYIGECGPGGGIRRVLEPLGICPTYRELDPDGFDTLVFPDMEFRVPKGLDAYRDRLVEAFPNERRAIDGYLSLFRKLVDVLRLGGPPKPADALRMARPLATTLRHCRTTLGSVFDRFDMSPRLRAVLAGEGGDYAVEPARASLLLHVAVVDHYLHGGAFYPEGGGQVVANALAEVIRRAGGEIILRTPVEEILVADGRVTGVRIRPPKPERERGVPNEIRAPIVVSNADLKRTLLELVPAEHLPARYRRRVDGYRMALPLYVQYLVIDRDLGAEGVRNTNYWVYPEDGIDAAYRAVRGGRMPERPFVFVSSASLKDPLNPRLCRPGQTNLQVMTVVPAAHEFWGLAAGGPACGERYRKNPAYRARKREVREALLRSAELALPGLADAIVYEEAATPVTHERFVRSSGGTSYGIESTPDQFLIWRPRPQTPIGGLYLTGASTIFGHGIAGVLGGGKQTAAIVANVPLAELNKLSLPPVPVESFSEAREPSLALEAERPTAGAARR